MGVPAREPVAKAGDIVEGRYRIISTLGEGGMGTVFLAEHQLIKRRVAIKILHPELATDATVVERFMNEARAAGTLGHPNIVESTDMGFTHNHVPYIVFEYLEGSLLTDEIYRVGGLPVRRAIRVAQQIASALEAAHNAGIIHRDLKSDNVFLTDKDDTSDHVKVLDFGISRFLHIDEESGGLVMGTPEFMAPEQISTPDAIDHRADIYALGVMLYEMITARRPFSNEDDPKTLMQRILSDTPPPLNRPEVPHGLGELILTKLLAKDPDDRYQSMQDVEMALDQFTTIVGDVPSARRSRPIRTVATDATGNVTARRIKTPQPRAKSNVPVAPPAPAKKPLVLYGLAGAGLLIGIIGIVIGTRGGSDAKAPPPAAPITTTVPTPSPTPQGTAKLAPPVEHTTPAPRTVEITLDANVPDAKVSFRRRVVTTPTTLQLPPNTIIELVEVSAPGHKTVKYWLTLDRPTKLAAKLPEGKGVVEATDDEILIALGELDEPPPEIAKAPDTPDTTPDKKRDKQAHARARTNRRVGHDTTPPDPTTATPESTPDPAPAPPSSTPEGAPTSPSSTSEGTPTAPSSTSEGTPAAPKDSEKMPSGYEDTLR